MLNERDLFGNDNAAAHARRCDPDTSHAAAADVTPSLRELQAIVLAYAFSRGSQGFTDPAMNEHFDTHTSTYRTRRAELVDYGLVADTGERLKMGKGRTHCVWRITESGRAEHLRLMVAGLDRAA
ncbi:MAG: hypothetical protein M3Q19_14515 [Pseudomonadota bacterium]|nr:hypothetical protein [Pseudomonadota bacterium]